MWMSIFLGGVIGAAAGFGWWKWQMKQGNTNAPQPPQGDLQGKTKTPSQQNPAVMVRYQVGELPVNIAAHETAYILELRPDHVRWITEVPNPSSRLLLWPQGYKKPKTKPAPVRAIYRCVLSNHGDTELLSVSLVIPIRFYQIKQMPLEVKVNGTKASAHVPFAGSDPRIRMGTIMTKGTEATLFYAGDVVSEHRHEVAIPSILGHGEVSLYLVNKSDLFTTFDLPQDITALVVGDSKRRAIDLIRSDVTAPDALKIMGLWPDNLAPSPL
ncbi:MAG: hypothetical protein LAN62_17350 [Acidobacteriia bacterium]|nr:hypothetical protein [Terriglobia bacterium]